MNDFPGFVVSNFLEIAIIVSVNYSLPVDKFVSAVGMIRSRELLNEWSIFVWALCLRSISIADYDGFGDRNTIVAFCTSAFSTWDAALRSVTTIVDWSFAICTFSCFVRLSHSGYQW